MRARWRYYYVRIADCETRFYLNKIEREIKGVRDSDLGTAKDPKSAWIEFSTEHLDTVLAVRQHLSLTFPDAHFPEVIEVTKGEGRTQSRQLDLFAEPPP